MDENRAKIDSYLTSLVANGVSDIHFKAKNVPLRRINGVLGRMEGVRALEVQDTETLARHMLGTQGWERFQETREADTSYSIPGHCRFRVAVFQQRGTISIILRIIPFDVPTLAQLGVPPTVEKLARSTHGLILVTGVTGSGKSSTLAGMIDYINKTKPSHIITIEDPIEFLHRDNKASINQREIGVDTGNFANAFRAALRQDPDIILVGELRDLETMGIALRAAETGHLVMSTVHTTDAKETIGRFIDSFPPYQQKQIRIQLASNLSGVISQRLLERVDGKGRVLAVEIMIVNAAIRELILDPDKVSKIGELIEKGVDQYGMQTFDQALLKLLQLGQITEDEAIRNATSPNDFRLKVSLG